MRLRHAWTNRDAESRASILGRPSLRNLHAVNRTWAEFFSFP
jgi:hypothetical protein